MCSQMFLSLCLYFIFIESSPLKLCAQMRLSCFDCGNLSWQIKNKYNRIHYRKQQLIKMQRMVFPSILFIFLPQFAFLIPGLLTQLRLATHSSPPNSTFADLQLEARNTIPRFLPLNQIFNIFVLLLSCMGCSYIWETRWFTMWLVALFSYFMHYYFGLYIIPFAVQSFSICNTFTFCYNSFAFVISGFGVIKSSLRSRIYLVPLRSVMISIYLDVIY